MDQIRINKEFVAEVLDFDIPNRVTHWKEFGGSGTTNECRILIDRFIEMDELKSGLVDYSNGIYGLPIIARGIEECDSGWYLYYDLDLSSETKPDAEHDDADNPIPS